MRAKVEVLQIWCCGSSEPIEVDVPVDGHTEFRCPHIEGRWCKVGLNGMVWCDYVRKVKKKVETEEA